MTLKTILGLTTVGFSLILGASQVNAAQVVLYNGSLNTLPSAQGQLIPGAIQSNGSVTLPSQTLVTGGVQVVTNANLAEYSGYSNYNPLTSSFVVGGAGTIYTLNQNPGYSIFFNVSLDSTTSSSDDRAAFSITAIGAGNQGIELGFESNLIFAQNNDFTRGEISGEINTSQAINYELRVIDSQYFLLANNNQILTGSLRSYTFNPSASSPPLPFNPYTIPNFIFLGDNTGQESGTFTLRSVSFDSIPFEFSPGLGLLILGSGLGLKQLKRKLNK